MNISSMRFFDRWLGIPACIALTLLRKVTPRAPRKGHVRPKKVLFIKLAEQGSTVLAYKALKLATERYGRENTYFMVFENNRFILDALDVVPEGNVIPVRTNDIWEVIRDAMEGLRRIRREKIDAAVDLEFFARSSAVLSFLSGARIRVGYHGFHGEGPYRGNLMTHRLFFNHHLHTTDAFQLFVEALEQPESAMPAFGSDIRLSFGRIDYAGPVKTRYVIDVRDEDYPLLDATDEEKEAVMELIKATGGEGAGAGRLILINANCSDIIPLRRWPQENYISLARRLMTEHDDVQIALVGGPDEAAAAVELVKQIGHERCFSLAGQTTMKELLTLYHLAEVLVTNDSGPAHFAALTPVQSVVLFGPETPLLFGSRSSRTHILWAGTAFTPCVNALNNRQSPTDSDECMRLISVDDVFATVDGILKPAG